jgi:hypothetical protein
VPGQPASISEQFHVRTTEIRVDVLQFVFLWPKTLWDGSLIFRFGDFAECTSIRQVRLVDPLGPQGVKNCGVYVRWADLHSVSEKDFHPILANGVVLMAWAVQLLQLDSTSVRWIHFGIAISPIGRVENDRSAYVAVF